MANKYIRHGATFCGDGTSSDLATVNGGVGAWNSIVHFEGTAVPYGAIVAGDVAYIRSKDEAGEDIIRPLTADRSLGLAGLSVDGPVYWVLDNGSVWPGVDGVLRYTSTNSTYNAAILSYNVIEAKTVGNLVFEFTGTTASDSTYLVQMLYGSHLIGPKIDGSSNTSNTRFSAARVAGVLESPIIKMGRLYSSNADSGAVISAQSIRGNLMVINPDIELTDPNIGGSGLFYIATTYEVNTTVTGGRVYGTGAVSGQCVVGQSNTSSTAGTVRLIGFSVPRSMAMVGASGFIDYAPACVEAIGCEAGIGGHYEMPWGWATSRTDNNPPYLAAALPDSVHTAWSYRVYPRQASVKNPMRLPCMKIYSDDADIRTITQQILVSNTMSPDSRNLWIEVEYTDSATGLPKHVSSRDFSGNAIAESTANWLPNTAGEVSWGIVTLLKRKLAITTPTAVKKDSAITVTLCSTLKSAIEDDIYFVDPDFGVL